jgi:hypothetical protein
MEFYSADIEMLMSWWNILYMQKSGLASFQWILFTAAKNDQAMCKWPDGATFSLGQSWCCIFLNTAWYRILLFVHQLHGDFKCLVIANLFPRKSHELRLD